MGNDDRRNRAAPPSILIVEDDDAAAEDLARFLAPDYDCARASNPREALTMAAKREFAAALVDLHLGAGMNGFDVIEELRRIDARTAILIVSGDTTEESLRRAARLDVQDFIPKSIGAAELRRSVRRSLILRRVSERVRRLEEERLASAGLLVADSPAMARVAAGAERASRHTAPVLITGPVGAGKMIVARQIHALGRRDRPFERVHCATLDTGDLADSQLFGYEPGAHSTAKGRFIGAFERAEDGTLLLDDIDYLPPRVQVKLLQPLEERIIRRLPGSVEVPVRCRILATTNKDLDAMVRAGAFRADLLSRLRGGQAIAVPGIGERKEDVPGLVSRLVAQICSEEGRFPLSIPEPFLSAVSSRSWLDARELANAVRYAVGVCAGGELSAADLPLPVGGPMPDGRDAHPARTGGDLPEGSLEAILSCVRAVAVARALERAHGDKKAAAAELGITVQWLNAILRTSGTGQDDPGAAG